MRFLYVLVSICLFLALLSIPFFILFDDNNIDADSAEFIFISNQKVIHESGNFDLKIFEDSKTGVQYILIRCYNGYGYSVSPRYNADGTLFTTKQPLGDD